ncbi:MAG: hypothetical protein M3Z29_07935 [Pseudomonadota bacterium]|nr:hypothetical protein [Pseudomonadota bacterium]
MLLAVVAAAVLNPIFMVPFEVLVGRMIFIAACLLIAFGVAGAWPPSRMPAWLAQVLAVVIAAPIATLLAYLRALVAMPLDMQAFACISFATVCIDQHPRGEKSWWISCTRSASRRRRTRSTRP